uniref:Uncharacterized protein n=1 Tax=viral metagenome TaxID=1070528 RepID=A0A6H1ZIX6_9ZZZZ
MDYTVTLSDGEEKALLTDMVSIQDWLDNAIHNKARQCIDNIVEQVSDKQPKKIPEPEKLEILRKAKVESAIERQARSDRELKAGMG